MQSRFIFRWKAGLLTALMFVIVGIGGFVLVGSQIDFSCKNAARSSAGCSVYNGVSTVVQGYADFWRQFFAPRCVGGNGPDDCLGPDALIMFFTLAIAGAVIGGTSRVPHKASPTPTQTT